MAEAGYLALQRSRTIVDALFDFAKAGGRADPEARAEASLVISEVLDQHRAEAQSTRVDLSTGALSKHGVRCAPAMLSIVLDNLVRNALKYVGDAGERRVEVRALDAGAAALFEVEDTEPGLPRGFEAVAFRAYVRGPNAKGQPGLGLGLATVRRIVQAHGGEAGVRPAVPKGSIFWFALPAA